MTGQVLRRLLLAVPLALAVSLLTFLLSRLAGGSYFDQFKTDRRFDPAQIRELERRAHLDQPLLMQWLHWLRGVCFDVRLARPVTLLQGFEQTGDLVASAHEGRRALRVVVPEEGDVLRLALPARPESTAANGGREGQLRIWRRDAASPDAAWQEQPLIAHEGAVELRLAGPATIELDSLELVDPELSLGFGRPDFGRSFKYDAPVFDLLMPALVRSFWLALATLVVTWLVAIPLATFGATRPGGFVDRLLSSVSFAGASIPGFFLALLALYVVVEWVNGATGRTLLPVGADRSPDHEALTWGARLLDRAWHLVLPVAVLSFGALASVQRTLRATLLETLSAPFVASARAKGLPERRIVRRHALRNALNPLVTLFGIRLAELLSGAALVEIVFQYPGMGRLVLDATISRDLYVVIGAVLIGALLLIVANLLADVALAWLDPRVQSLGARARA